jgi:hypothetical protein
VPVSPFRNQSGHLPDGQRDLTADICHRPDSLHELDLLLIGESTRGAFDLRDRFDSVHNGGWLGLPTCLLLIMGRDLFRFPLFYFPFFSVLLQSPVDCREDIS